MSFLVAPPSIRWLRVAVVFGALIHSPRGMADDRGDSAAAQALFDEAKDLMNAGRHVEACPKLEESQRLDPAGGTLLNLGKCYELTGRIASAWSTYLEAAAASRASGHAERERAARAFASALAPRLPKLVITVGPQAQVPGLRIRRDGELVRPPQWEVPIAADPGRHTVEASAPGHEPWKRSVELAEGQTLQVRLPALSGSSAAVGEDDQTEHGLGTQRTVALWVGGAGVVGIGFGTVFGLQSMSDRNAADDFCDGAACRSQEGVDLRNDARSAGTLSTIGFAVGAVGLGGGAALWLTADAPAEGHPVSVGLGPDAIRVRGVW